MPEPVSLPTLTRGDIARFWKYVEKTDACWVWSGTKTKSGYGTINVNHHHWLVHRVSYQIHHGNVPVSLTIDHLCRNRACVNPAHLEAVTQRVNVLRGNTTAARNAAKTHCKRGHELSPDNVRIIQGARHCLTCRKERIQKNGLLLMQSRRDPNIVARHKSLQVYEIVEYPCYECGVVAQMPYYLKHPDLCRPRSNITGHVCVDCFNKLIHRHDSGAPTYSMEMLRNPYWHSQLFKQRYVGQGSRRKGA